MNELLLTWAGGLASGAVHVVVSADHLAALAPFAIDARSGAWRVGLRWGLGHALGVVAVGLVARAALDRMALERWEGLGHALAGVLLILIGCWGLTHARRLRWSALGGATIHEHVHSGASLLVGVAHGVGGTAAILGVMPALALSTWVLASSYLCAFALGTIAAMVSMAWLVGVSARTSWGSTERAYRTLFVGASGVCLLLGILWLMLFLAGVHPH